MAPVVLLHGFAHPPTSWREVEGALSGSFDLRPCPTPGHSSEAPVAADWDSTLAAFAIPSDAIAVGYSFGARLALGLLAADRVAAAILIGVNPGLADPAARAARRADDARWIARLRAGSTADFLAAWEAQPLFASQATASPEVRARRHVERSALDPAGLADALAVLGLGAMPDLGPALAAANRRARLVVGERDQRFRAIAAATHLPVTLVPSSGHDPTLEAPAALAAIIADSVSRLTQR